MYLQFIFGWTKLINLVIFVEQDKMLILLFPWLEQDSISARKYDQSIPPSYERISKITWICKTGVKTGSWLDIKVEFATVPQHLFSPSQLACPQVSTSLFFPLSLHTELPALDGFKHKSLLYISKPQ